MKKIRKQKKIIPGNFKEMISYNGKKVKIIWNNKTDFSKLKKITQVYGVIFNKKGEILIISVKKNKWSLPGGTPEPKDSSFEDTLKREILEEADVEIENITPLGYIHFLYIGEKNSDNQQLRYLATIKKILPQTIDPAYGIIPKRKFIHPDEFLKYCPWGKIGKVQIEKSKEIIKKINYNPLKDY